MENLLAEARKKAVPKLPRALEKIDQLVPELGEKSPVDPAIAPLFPHLSREIIRFKEGAFECAPLKVGVVLSGGQA
ncbi:MAG: diphosphate--fructose-6-phosphate 1-phosphotransferase, partial [Parachlamydiaceae bacterium]